jgi:CheY-like chemotaxis protein/DNA-binding CsgD family transcriptional regulator
VDRPDVTGDQRDLAKGERVATILVVDDEPDIRMLVRFTLELDGHEIVEAADGGDALEIVDRHRPDLVVLDVMMPTVSGWDTLVALKSHTDERVQRVPVVMLTALSSDLDRARGGIEGAVHYLAKPISPDDLRATVADALAADEPEQRRRARHRALETLARIEAGGVPSAGAPPTEPRPRLTGLEPRRFARRRARSSPPPDLRPLAATLTAKQRELLEGVRASATVKDAAEKLGMSRSNVYASLRRIARRLGVASTPELLALVRAGHVVE